jgi:dienelactone hydrolase
MGDVDVAIPLPSGGSIFATETVPAEPRGIIVFAHGSGSSRHSPRNRLVADILQAEGFGTLLLDLLTAEEDEVDRQSGALRFDIPLLAQRLVTAIAWVRKRPYGTGVPIGLFGASTGAAAALAAAAAVPHEVAAVVSRGGRPDLAGPHLHAVRAPTLLIVGSADPDVYALNRHALALLRPRARLAVVPGASHLFEEPGTLERAAHVARDWFARYLRR